MTGKLVLTTPWSREGMTDVDRKIIEHAIPDDHWLTVSVSSERRWWLLWLNHAGQEKRDAVLKVSRVLSLRQAALWALHNRWGTLRRISTADNGGYDDA